MTGSTVWAQWPLASGVEVPIVPSLLALVGAGLIFVFAVQALKPVQRAPRAASASPQKEIRPPPPPPAAPAPEPKVQHKRAPFNIHFPRIKPEYPDVWGIGEPVEIALEATEKRLQEKAEIPGLTLTIGGQVHRVSFSRGTATLRRAFDRPGEVPVVVDVKVKGETQPRRTARTLKIVQYRTEIADVFANFREEASRVIAPIRDDATPWEIYDILTEANPKLPAAKLREIISCFEVAKYSNHPVNRDTYARMIDALLQLENVEL